MALLVGECPQHGLTTAGLFNEIEYRPAPSIFDLEATGRGVLVSESRPAMHPSQASPGTVRDAVPTDLVVAAKLLWPIPAARRPGVLVRALACVPEISLEASFASGPLRAALSSSWEAMTGMVLPVESLRCRLERRDDAVMISAICGVALAQSQGQITERLAVLVERLVELRAQELLIESARDYGERSP